MRTLPPEWHQQSAVMLTWPHKHGIWLPYADEADVPFTQIAKEIAKRQKVLISCYDTAHFQHISQLLQKANAKMDNVSFKEVRSNDIWVRDHGPLTVVDGKAATLLDFDFNAWGGKYTFNYDNHLSRSLHAQGAFGHVPLETQSMILEGGAIEVDGEGTLLTTESVMLNPNRNTFSRAETERRLCQAFGQKRVLWLAHGHLVGDDTDGHIDTLARFVASDTIVYCACEDKTDEHYAPLLAMRKELEAFKRLDGSPYKLVPIPLPDAQCKPNGDRLPATYANFLIINGAVLVPTYGARQDAEAVRILKQVFKHEVIAINCRPLINFYGSLHCATMQIPTEVRL